MPPIQHTLFLFLLIFLLSVVQSTPAQHQVLPHAPPDESNDPINDCPDVPEGKDYVQTLFASYAMPVNDYKVYLVAHSLYQTCIPIKEAFTFNFGPPFIDRQFDSFTICLRAKDVSVPMFTSCVTTQRQEITPDPTPEDPTPQPFPVLTATLLHDWQYIPLSLRQISWVIEISPVNPGSMESIQNFHQDFEFIQHHPTISTFTHVAHPPFHVNPVLSSDVTVYAMMIDDAVDRTATFQVQINHIKFDAQSISISYIGDGCLQLDTKYQKMLNLYPNYRDALGGDDLEDDEQAPPPPAPTTVYSCAHPHTYDPTPTVLPKRVKCLINGNLVYGYRYQSYNPDARLYTPVITVDYPFRIGLDYTITCIHMFLVRDTRVTGSLENYVPLDVFHVTVEPVSVDPEPPDMRIGSQVRRRPEEDRSAHPVALSRLQTTGRTFFSDYTTSSAYKPILITTVFPDLGSSDHALYVQLAMSFPGNTLSQTDSLFCRFNDGLVHTEHNPINLGPLLVNITSANEQSLTELYSAIIEPIQQRHHDGSRTIHPYAEFDFKFIRFADHPQFKTVQSLTFVFQTMSSLIDLEIGESMQMSCMFTHNAQLSGDLDPPNQPAQFHTTDLPPEIYNPTHITPITIDSFVSTTIASVSLRIFLAASEEPPDTPVIPSLIQIGDLGPKYGPADGVQNIPPSIEADNQHSFLLPSQLTAPTLNDINPGRSSFVLVLTEVIRTRFSSLSIYLLGNHRFGGGWVCYVADGSRKIPLTGTANVYNTVIQPSITNREVYHNNLPVMDNNLSVITFTNIDLDPPDSDPDPPEQKQQLSQYELWCQDGFILADTVTKFYSPSYFHIDAVAEPLTPDYEPMYLAFGATFKPPRPELPLPPPQGLTDAFTVFAYISTAFVLFVCLAIITLRLYLRCTQKLQLEKLEMQSQEQSINQFHPSHQQQSQRNHGKQQLKLGPQQLLLDEQIGSLL